MKSETDFRNADKEWDSETLEYIARVLEDEGPRPGEMLTGRDQTI